jgi:hypothetical protein
MESGFCIFTHRKTTLYFGEHEAVILQHLLRTTS